MTILYVHVPFTTFLYLYEEQFLTANCQVRCKGQQPNSYIVADIAHHTITPDGHIQAKPTLQIADDSLPNVYVCGDVAGYGERNPNARSAMRKAMIAADNVLLAIAGRAPTHRYKPSWADGFIKLTLGMVSFSGRDKSQATKINRW